MTGAVAATPLTRPITDLSRADIPYAGGKGANLGELTAAGMPVPDGFVVGAPTYARYVDETGLRGSCGLRTIATGLRSPPATIVDYRRRWRVRR